MKNDLFFDFTVDKAANIVRIVREFDAGLALVWDAFTKAELLDQWVAPDPYTARTKYMNFEVGGKRFYAMVSPEGKESWALQKYTSISPKTNYKMWNAFADENENTEPFGSDWDFTFIEQESTTRVVITIFNESFERMEGLMEGFKEGYTITLQNLDNLLERLSQKA
ncbi:MAG: SRPBCC domain-containing protein [Saprospiraceae bacterium]|nr:SRPBCC domain-containing protein [Saprospiraceae bacterium]